MFATSNGIFFAGNNSRARAGGIDQFTRLVIDMNGSNGGTVFTDGSTFQAPKTLTATTFTTTTAQFPFGNASGTAATTGYVEAADSSDFALAQQAFTWGVYFRTPNAGALSGLTSQVQGADNKLFIYYNSDGKLFFGQQNGFPTGCYWTTTSSLGIIANTWYYIEIDRPASVSSISDWKVFLGVPGGTATSQALTLTNGTANYNFQDISAPFRVGGDTVIADLNGAFLHGFKLDVGIARHSSSFTVPQSDWTT